MRFKRTSIRGRELPVYLRSSVYCLVAAGLVLCGGLRQAWGAPASTTVLGIASGGGAATTVTSGSVVTLTATVMAGGAAVAPGQVNFCVATAKSCTDIHLLGTAQLTGAGTAALKFRPGIGSHSYKAVFLGTTNAAASSSAAASVTVVAESLPSPSVTTITSSGLQGTYSLTATVSGNGGAAPTGSVSFVDTSNANAVLATAALTPVTTGATFLSSGIQIEAPVLVAAGDFNGDGIPDLVAIQAFGTGFIMLGNGDATFESTQTFTASASGIVSGDFISSIALKADRQPPPSVQLQNIAVVAACGVLGNGSCRCGGRAARRCRSRRERIHHTGHQRIRRLVANVPTCGLECSRSSCNTSRDSARRSARRKATQRSHAGR
jgi:hypothetical protein